MVAQVISRQEAARELLRRQLAQESIVGFSKSIIIPGAPVSEDDPDDWVCKPIETDVAIHHQVMMNEIERCIRTDYGRLMIFAPPGSAKSTYTSVVSPAWAMGMFPGLRTLMVGASAGVIERHSKRVRNIIAQPAYRNIWDKETSYLSGGQHEFELTNSSGLIAAGILGDIVGSRMDVGIADDLVAGREEAESPVIRRKIRAAWEDDFLTRLKPSASIILMNTRWHPDDLPGSILPEDYDGRSGDILCRDGMVWRVLNIQAKCERKDDPVGRKIGEYLWPEWFGPQHWKIFESNARTWNAMYQQRPTLGSGGHYREEDFHRYDRAPDDVVYYMPGDWAVTDISDSDRPDFTSFAAIGIDPRGEIWCEHGYVGQKKLDVTIPLYIDMARTYKAKVGMMEGGTIRRAMEGQLARQMRETKPKPYYLAMEYPAGAGKDKTANSASFRALANAGKVHVKNGPWGNALIAQLCAFPFTTVDDMVDMMGLVGRFIDDMHASKRDKTNPIGPRKAPPTVREMFELMDKTERDEQARRKRSFRG